MRPFGSVTSLLAALVTPALLAACLPMAGPGGGRQAPFPECDGAELAFFGENTTLAAIGLGETAGPDANRVGTIWVTAGPVDPESINGPGARGPIMPPQRWVCVEWPDGSGMGMNIDDAWRPPGGFLDGTATDNPALAIGAIVLLLLVVGGASFLAFRGERGAA